MKKLGIELFSGDSEIKRMGLRDYTIYNILKRNARVHPNRIALISGDQKLSHREFLEKVDRVAYGLWSTGLEKGDRIAVLAENSLEFIYLYGAAAKIGAILLPINWRLNQKEMEYIICDGTPKAVFVSSEFQPMISPLIRNCPFIEKCFAIGKAYEGFLAFSELIKNDGICPEVDVCSDDIFVIIHTAAVQGKPRGAMLNHQGILISNLQFMYFWNLAEEDVHLVMLPLFHLTALGMTLSVIHAGGSNVIVPRFESDLALKHIEKDRVTIFGEFPPMLKNMLDKAQQGTYDLSSLRIVVGLDDLATIRKLEEMTKATFWTAYGQTEVSGLVTFAPYSEKPGSAGIPNFMLDVEIAGDDGNILGPGKLGEIVVRGPMVFKGYWNLEKENEYTFRDGWHHTGDMGYFDANGCLWYKGRKAEKELIKSGGENVYPSEVEKAILEHPMVEEVAVIGVPDPQWGETIKAICVLKKGESLKEIELIEFVATRIARYKKPKYVVFVSHLPKTAGGLIDRENVKAQFG